jgi:hypothetical protein
MAPVAGGSGAVLSCRVIATRPTIVAEIVFDERTGAENVVATFNDQRVRKKNLLPQKTILYIFYCYDFFFDLFCFLDFFFSFLFLI